MSLNQFRTDNLDPSSGDKSPDQPEQSSSAPGIHYTYSRPTEVSSREWNKSVIIDKKGETRFLLSSPVEGFSTSHITYFYFSRKDSGEIEGVRVSLDSPTATGNRTVFIDKQPYLDQFIAFISRHFPGEL